MYEIEEGMPCIYGNCSGHFFYFLDEPCQCATGPPPCSACVEARLWCNKCLFSAEGVENLLKQNFKGGTHTEEEVELFKLAGYRYLW